MTVSFKFETAKAIHKDGALPQLDYWVRRTLDDPDADNTQIFQIDLSKYKKEEIKKLQTSAIKNEASQKTLTTITTWLDILDNPAEGVITSLASFEKVFIAFYKKCKIKWLWATNKDGCIVPYVIDEVKNVPRRDGEEGYLYIKLKRGKLSTDENSDDSSRYGLDVNIYKSDISDDESDDFLFSALNGNSEIDEEEADEVEKPKKRKKEGKPLHELLAQKNLFLHNDRLQENYIKEVIEQRRLIKLIGNQFTSDLKYGLNIEKSEWGSSRNSWVPLSDEDGLFKLIIDEAKSEENVKSFTTDSKTFGNGVLQANDPYIRCYDISKHRTVYVHATHLKEYIYNQNIIDGLILNENDKFILNGIISGSASEITEDVIKGKSGGLIILGSGRAGVGKTLTAEVYSEYLSKPLYSVQSSQLGIDLKTIEDRLYNILKRAEKWDAVLLIDEADSYVQKRGEDILQNSIVGVFLRLLEYFQGVLFLTTNRHDIIDEAILSRVTAHVRYEIPNQENAVKIWGLLCKNYQLKIDIETINSLSKDNKMSGREIRNTIKLIKKIFPKEKITETHFNRIKNYRTNLG